MTGPREIRIDRLVLPASQAHNAAAFRAALERGLAAQTSGAPVPSSSVPLADRTAAAVAARIAGAKP